MLGECGWGVWRDPGHQVDDLGAVGVDYAEFGAGKEWEGGGLGGGDGGVCGFGLGLGFVSWFGA